MVPVGAQPCSQVFKNLNKEALKTQPQVRSRDNFLPSSGGGGLCSSTAMGQRHPCPLIKLCITAVPESEGELMARHQTQQEGAFITLVGL